MALLKRIAARPLRFIRRVRRSFRRKSTRNAVSDVTAELPTHLGDIPPAVLTGKWDIRVRDSDMLIKGQADGPGPVYLFFNSRLLGVGSLSGKPRAFRFLIQSAGKGLAKGSTFHLATPKGIVPHASGRDPWVAEGEFAAETGFFDLDRRINAGRRLTKKGSLTPPGVPRSVKQEYYEAYSALSNWFGETLNYPVLVSHGTLLGLYRDGDMIPHDDDFDCCYLSEQPDVGSVVKERATIMHEMREAGFDFKVGSTGHIKVIWNKQMLDLMPAWITTHDTLYISSYSEINGASEFVKPISQLQWKPFGAVNTFARPERFLEGQYGPGWRVPDPGYRVKISAKCKSNLKALEPSLEEAKEFGTGLLKRKYGLVAA